MKKRLLLISSGLFLIALSWVGCKASRAGYEGPEYSVLSKSGDFETRRYQAMVGASTTMTVNKDGGRNNGFGRLFKYITGENEENEKIAMTSPIFVDTDENASEASMMFVIPEETIEGGVPTPTAKTVTVKKIPGGDFAVLGFKGHKSKEAQREALATLRKTISEKGLTIQGEPVFAYYDPPWTPELLRRNEVLLRVTGVKD